MPIFGLTVLLFICVNLHLLRNISPLFLGLPGLFYGLLLLAGAMRGRGLTGEVGVAFAIYLFATGYTALISLDNLSGGELASAVPRLLFLAPLPICFAIGLRSDRDVRKVLCIYLGFIAIGCLSLPLQLLTGPISWFAQSSERGGLERYASLFGNLTAVGIVGAIGLLGLLLIDGSLFWRAVGGIVCVIGLVLSLQKAAVVNLVACIGLYFLFAEGSIFRKVRQFAIGIVALMSIGTVAFAAAGDLTPYFATVGATYIPGASGSGIRDDETIRQSLEKRLVVFPETMLHEMGPSSALTGVGLRGMGGVMGMDYYDMAHNTYYDFLFSGGVIYLGALLILMIALFREFRRALADAQGDILRRNNLRVLAAICTLVLVNLPASSGVLFHPNLSSGVWLAVGTLAGVYSRSSRDSRDSRVRELSAATPV